MKAFRFVCAITILVFAILMIVLVVAQSHPVAHGNQLNAIPERQKLPAPAVAMQSPQLSFAKAVAYNSGGYDPDSVAVGDLNGDGIPDLVVANCSSNNVTCESSPTGEVDVLLGNGDGTFQAAVGYGSGGYKALSIEIGDVNGDGYPDLVVANYCQSGNCESGGEASVLLGNGDGTFQPALSYGSGGYYAESVAVADFDGDGKLDLVVANYCETQACDNGSASVLMGNGNGTFQAPVSYDSGGTQANSVVISDLDGDGVPDLVVAQQCPTMDCDFGEVSVLLGNGDGTFRAPVTYSSGGYDAHSVAVGDVNGDGRPDLAVGNSCPSGSCSGGIVGVLLNNGDGTFQAPVTYSTGGNVLESLAIGDINGDGLADLVVANACETIQKTGNCQTRPGWVSVLLGNSDGTFQTPVGYNSGGYGGVAVAIADLNGDGRPDLAVTNFYASKNHTTGSVGVLLNSFIARTTIVVTSSPNPSQVNQTVTFTATIASTPAVPNGEIVTFYEGKTSLGTGATTNGMASLTTSFSKAKTYTIKATYPGDAFHKASTGTVKQVVNP